jgi:Tfp pilus assembly protein PilP
VLSLLVAVAASGLACGGKAKKTGGTTTAAASSEEGGEKKKRRGAPPPAPTEAAAPQANPRFAMLKPYFSLYYKRPVDTKTNLFRNNLAQFAPRVEIETEVEKPSEEPKTPLEYYDVDSYRLVLIMSGTAQAKALVTDPKDKSFIIMVGTRIGNRGGKVASITATEVRIEEPGRQPVVKALEPPTRDMEKELQSVQEM